MLRPTPRNLIRHLCYVGYTRITDCQSHLVIQTRLTCTAKYVGVSTQHVGQNERRLEIVGAVVILLADVVSRKGYPISSSHKMKYVSRLSGLFVGYGAEARDDSSPGAYG